MIEDRCCLYIGPGVLNSVCIRRWTVGSWVISTTPIPRSSVECPPHLTRYDVLHQTMYRGVDSLAVFYRSLVHLLSVLLGLEQEAIFLKFQLYSAINT